MKLPASDSSVQGMFVGGASRCGYVLGLPRSDRALVSERPIPHQPALFLASISVGRCRPPWMGFVGPDARDGGCLRSLPSGCHHRGKGEAVVNQGRVYGLNGTSIGSQIGGASLGAACFLT